MQHSESLTAPRPSRGAADGSGRIVAHQAWREAHDQVLAAVRAGRGLVLLSGLAGTGKTLLLRELARTLRAAGFDALLQPRGDIPIDSGQVEAGGAGEGGPRVVLIDEAHRMDQAALGQLGRLGARSFVLAGLAGPEGGLPAGAVVVRLAPLGRDEIGGFVAARLAQAGQQADRISAQAVTRLAERSRGVPRVLDMLIGAVLFLAGTGRIEAAHVDEAAVLRGDPEADDQPSPRPPDAATVSRPAAQARTGTPAHVRAAILGAAVSVGAACGWLILRPGGPFRQAPPVLAAQSLVSNGLAKPGPDVPARTAPPAPAVTVPEQRAIAPEAPAQAPAPFEELPSGAPARVVLHYARGDAGAASRAASLALALREAGFPVGDPVAAAGHGRAGVRYFFAEDREAASAVLRSAKLPGESMPAVAGRGPPPRPGTIEVVVSSN